MIKNMGALLGITAIVTSLSPIADVVSAASAQEEAGQPSEKTLRAGFEEIVVSARRREESLQDVPVAVSVASGESLRQMNIVQLGDLQRIAPSLIVTNSMRGAAYPAYSIRGQRSAYTPNPVSDPSIGLYFADVNMGLGLGSNNVMYDLESVQVLRGPQGTLFGRNATGGAILIVPKAPSDEVEGYVAGAIGDYDYLDGEAMINLPVTEGVALRVSGKITRRDGFMKNVLTGQRGDNKDSDAARVSLKFNPSSSLESTFIATYVEDRSNHAYKLHDVSLAGFTSTLTGSAGPVLGGLLGGAAYGIALPELTATQALGKYEFRTDREVYNFARIWSVQNTTSYEAGAVTFKNIMGYREVKTGLNHAWDGSSVDIFSTDEGRTQSDIFSEEFQILGDFGELSIVGGIYHYRSNDTERLLANIFGLLQPIVPTVFPIMEIADYDVRSRSTAVFLHGDYDLGNVIEGLSISAGIRYTWDKRSLEWFNMSGNGNPTAWRCSRTGTPIMNPDRQDICMTSESEKYKEPTWGVSLNYQASSDLLLYLAHRRGYRSGGFNSAPQQGGISSFQPEIIDDMELGLKSDFLLGDVSGRLNIAAYYSWYDDIQRSVGRVLPNGAINSRIENAASAKIKGIEAELWLNLTNDLSVSGGYSYVDASYSEWTDLYPAGNIPGSPALSVDVSDSKFAYIPKHQFNASVLYDLPMPDNMGDLSTRLTVYGISKFEIQEINTANCGPDGAYGPCLLNGTGLRGYAVANFRLDWQNVAGSGVHAAVFVNNITDKFYRVDSVGATHLGFQSVGIGAPRMFGLEVRVPFGALE